MVKARYVSSIDAYAITDIDLSEWVTLQNGLRKLRDDPSDMMELSDSERLLEVFRKADE